MPNKKQFCQNILTDLHFWSSRLKTDVPHTCFMFDTNFHSPRPIFYLPNSKCICIDELSLTANDNILESMVKQHWFKTTTNSKLQQIVNYAHNYWGIMYNRNTAWLRDTVRQTSRGKSAAAGRTAPATDFPRDVCLTVSRNHAVFLLSSTNI